MSKQIRRTIFATIVLAATLQMSGCVTMGPAAVAFPAEVQVLDHQPLLSGDDENVRLGPKPVYALLQVSPAPQRAWSLVQLSNAPLSPQRDNQEVVRFDTALKNVFPTFVGDTYTYKSDPVTGVRSNFRVEVDQAPKAYALTKSNRRRGYSIASSAFSHTDFDVILGSGTVSRVARSWALNSDALRTAIVQTDLLAKARAFQAGDRTHGSAPAPLAPMSVGDQVWLVIPSDNESSRYYFVPERFETESGNLIEAGSTLGVFVDRKTVPWEQVNRVKAYNKRTIPGSQGVSTRYCADMVFDVAGKPAIKDAICSYGPDWRYSFLARSPSLGTVEAVKVVGQRYSHQGQRARSLDTIALDNSYRWDIKVLSAQEATAAKRLFK